MRSVRASCNVWKSLSIGTGFTNAAEFRAATQTAGMWVNEFTDRFLDKPQITVSSKRIEIDLAKVSVAELGFKCGATFEDICKAAKGIGYHLCPNEVGPQLRLQYPDQPMGELLNIGMEPIYISDDYLELLRVGANSDGRWLDSYWYCPSQYWSAGRCFVFVVPRE